MSIRTESAAKLMKDKLKGSLKSSVIWINGVLGVVIPALDYAQNSFPVLRGLLPEGLYVKGFIAITVLNMLLRFFLTNGPLENK